MRGTDWHSQVLSLLVVAGLSFGAGLSLGWAIWKGGLPSETIQITEAPPPETGPGDLAADSPTAPAAPVASVAPAETAPPDLWPARHLFIAVEGQWLSQASREFLREIKPGGVILRAENLVNPTQTLTLVRELKEAVGLGRQQFTDLPLTAMEYDSDTQASIGLASAPDAAALGQSGDRQRARGEGVRLAEASSERGINIVFAPVLDVFEHGAAMTHLASQSFGSDRALVTSMGLAFAEGIMEADVIPVAKHFPGYGAATHARGGLTLELNKDMNGLAEAMFPFNEAVNQGILGMMVGHVAVPALDKSDPARPASLSPLLVDTILRQRWGYDGVIISDDVSAPRLLGDLSPGEAAVRALAAGCDAVVLLNPGESVIREVCHAIEQAVEDGRLTRQQLDVSRHRLERWRAWLDRPAHVPSRPTFGSPASTPPAALPAEPAPQHTEGAPWQIAQVPESRDETQRPIASSPEPDLPAPEIDENGLPFEPEVTAQDEDVDKVEVPDSADPVEIERPSADDATPEQESGGVEQPSDGREAESPEETIEHPVDSDATAAPEADREDLGETTAIPEDEVEEVEGAPDEPHDATVEETDETGDQPVGTPESPEETAATIAADVPDEDSPAPDSVEEIEEEAKPEVPADAKVVTHLIEPGETLSEIAQRYGVSMADVRSWNDLEDSTIRSGGRLTIYTDPSAAPAARTPLNADEISPGYTTYEVQPGDTLLRISRRFNTPPATILSLNNISDPNHITVGQRLRVPVQ